MTLIEAKKFARRKTLKATGIMLAFLVFMFLLEETRGDFANGILFFISALTNIHTIVIVAILFGLTYLFAGRAGEEVIIKKQNNLLISLKYVVLISLAISVYAMFICLLRQNDFAFNGIIKIASEFLLVMFLKTSISLLIVWFWATSKMKSIGK